MIRILTNTGLSVAFLALTSAATFAQDAVEEGVVDTTDEIAFEEEIDPGVADGVVTDEDMIAWSGEVDESTGDEGTEEVPVDDSTPDEGEGEVIVVDDVEYLYDTPPDVAGGEPTVSTESECGGCEYSTTGGVDRPVMPNARGDIAAQRSAPGADKANDIDIFARGNICFDAETYIGLLCDWQRPFLGDLMPAQ